MFCKKCGNKMSDGAMFCKKCGNKIERNFNVPEESKLVGAPKQQYSAPQYGMPAPAVQKKASRLKYILIPTGILAVVAVLIAVLVTTSDQHQSLSVNQGYVQQNSSNMGGNTGGSTSSSVEKNTSGSVGENTSENVGGNTGGSTQIPVSEERYTSPVTGTVFTVPEVGRASVSLNGTEKTVPAENTYASLTSVYTYDNYFCVYFDGSVTASNLKIYFCLEKQSDWKAGKSYSLKDMNTHDASEISAKGFYTDKYGDVSFSWETFGNVYKDAQFTIIDRNSSTGEMKWYFYVKMSADGDSYIVAEGVAHTVYGVETTSSSDSYLENSNSYGQDGEGYINGNYGGNDNDIGGGNAVRFCGSCYGTGKCNVCHGRAICQVCFGRGGMSVVTYGQDVDDWVICEGCKGNRKCKYCNGDGRCSSCGGSGYN